MNYEDKVHKVEDILNNWQKQEINASWKDYNYKDVGCIPIGLKINVLLFKFLWDGKKPKLNGLK